MEKRWLEGIVDLVYIVDLSPSLTIGELLVSQDFTTILRFCIPESWCVCVCGENTRMTFVVKHAAASNELPCLHSLKTVVLKAEILISSLTHVCMHIHAEVCVVLVSSQTS